MQHFDPALAYTAAELIFAAVMMLAAVVWGDYMEAKARRRRGPWDKK